MKSLALIILASALAASSTQAQTAPWPPQPGASAMDQHRYQVDQNRLAIEQMRRDADRREAQAREARFDTEAARRRIEAARPPAPLPPAPVYSSQAARQEVLVQSRQGTAEGATQIDRWLNRRPR